MLGYSLYSCMVDSTYCRVSDHYFLATDEEIKEKISLNVINAFFLYSTVLLNE